MRMNMGMSVGHIDELVRNINKKYEFTDGFDLLKQMDLEVREIEGITDRVDLIKGVFYIRGDMKEEFVNFQLMHLLGHALLHCGIGNIFSDSVFKDTSNDKELEANYFASTLLMPEGDICKTFYDNVDDKGYVRIDKIAEEYKVTKGMAINRCKEIGLISWWQ